MIEFTETEPREVIDSYAEALNRIAEKAYREPSTLKISPRNTFVSRLDSVRANHPKSVAPSYKVYRRMALSTEGFEKK
jgi:glycine dehydrogenase subunit 2